MFDTIPKGMGDGDLGCCFALTMSMEETDGAMPCRTRRGLGSRGSDVGVNRREPECWVYLTRVLGCLWVVVLMLSCPLSGCRIPKGLEMKTLDVVFLLPSRWNGGVPRRARRGVGHISGVRSQGQSTRCRVLDAPDAGVGALVGGCLVVVLPVVSASLRVGVYGLCVLRP